MSPPSLLLCRAQRKADVDSTASTRGTVPRISGQSCPDQVMCRPVPPDIFGMLRPWERESSLKNSITSLMASSFSPGNTARCRKFTMQGISRFSFIQTGSSFPAPTLSVFPAREAQAGFLLTMIRGQQVAGICLAPIQTAVSAQIVTQGSEQDSTLHTMKSWPRPLARLVSLSEPEKPHEKWQDKHMEQEFGVVVKCSLGCPHPVVQCLCFSLSSVSISVPYWGSCHLRGLRVHPPGISV